MEAVPWTNHVIGKAWRSLEDMRLQILEWENSVGETLDNISISPSGKSNGIHIYGGIQIQLSKQVQFTRGPIFKCHFENQVLKKSTVKIDLKQELNFPPQCFFVLP